MTDFLPSAEKNSFAAKKNYFCQDDVFFCGNNRFSSTQWQQEAQISPRDRAMRRVN